MLALEEIINICEILVLKYFYRWGSKYQCRPSKLTFHLISDQYDSRKRHSVVY